MVEFFTRVFKNPETVVKFFVALVGAVGVAVSLGLVPESWSKWVAVAVAFLTSLGVYGAKNKPDTPPEAP